MKIISLPLLVVLSGFFCLEFGLPVAIGEILAGLIGEHFFKLSDLPFLKFLSDFGIVSLMFLAGYEIDLNTLKKNYFKSTVIGVSSFFVPFIVCFFVSTYFFDLTFKQSLILGIAISTTSLAIVFPSVKDKGLINKQSGQLLLSSAMMVDLISMVMLSLAIYEPTLEKMVFLFLVVLGIYVTKRFLFHLLKRYKGNSSEFELKFLLLVILGIGALADAAGMKAAIFCFILGMVFSSSHDDHFVLIDKLNPIVFALLSPAFFFHAGTKIKVSEIDSQTVILVLIFLSIAVIGKYIGTYLALSHYKHPLAKYGSFLFNYRLSFGIIAIKMGFDMKLISQQFFTSVMLVILLSSCIVAYFEKQYKIDENIE